VADQLPAEVTEIKADVLSVPEPVKAAPAPVKDEKVAAAASAPAPQPQPAKAETRTQPAAKPAAKTETKKKQARRKAAAKTATRGKPAKSPVVARKTKPAVRPVSKATPPAAKPVSKAIRLAAKPALNTARTATKVARTIETGVKTMANTTTSKAAETGQIAAEQFRVAFGDINERAKAAAEKTTKVVEQIADLTRGNVEAIVASSKIAAKGVETMSQDAAEYGRKSFEEASAVLKSFAEVKSATDFFKLQGDYARSAFDAAVAESARVSESMLKLAGEVAEPINSRYTVAAERVKTLAA
jgi:phasin family protein